MAAARARPPPERARRGPTGCNRLRIEPRPPQHVHRHPERLKGSDGYAGLVGPRPSFSNEDRFVAGAIGHPASFFSFQLRQKLGTLDQVAFGAKLGLDGFDGLTIYYGLVRLTK